MATLGELYAAKQPKNTLGQMYFNKQSPKDILGMDVDDRVLAYVKQAYEAKAASDYDLNYDQARMSNGMLPTSYDRKYKKTSQDRWLYQNKLPSASEFADYYTAAAEALAKEDEKQRKENAPKQQREALARAIAEYSYRSDGPDHDDKDYGFIDTNKAMEFLQKTITGEQYADLKDKMDRASEPSSEEKEYDTDLEKQMAEYHDGNKGDDYSITGILRDANRLASRDIRGRESRMAANGMFDSKPVLTPSGLDNSTTPGNDAQGALQPAETEEEKAARMATYKAWGADPQAMDAERSQWIKADAQIKQDNTAYDARMLRQTQLDHLRSRYISQDTQNTARDEGIENGGGKDLPAAARALGELSGSFDEYSETPDMASGVDEFRRVAKAQGYTEFEIDNTLKRAGLDQFVEGQSGLKNYIVDTVHQQGTSEVDSEKYYSSLTEEEKAEWFADMQFDPRVHTTYSEEVLRSIISVPIRAGLDIASGAVSFADSLVGSGEDMWNVTNTLLEASEKARMFGQNENHKYLNVMNDVASEIVKMYALNYAGTLVASGIGVSGVAGALSLPEKGLGLALKYGMKAWNYGAASAPFMLNAIGGYFAQAMNDGATRQQATQFAIPAGLFEGAVEKLAFGETFEGLISSRLAPRTMLTGTKALFARFGQQAIHIATSALGEGVEEGLSYTVSGLMQKAIYNPDWVFDADQFWSDFGMGALIGTFGAAMSFDEGTRPRQLLDDMMKNGYTSEAMDELKAAVEVEAMSAEKVQSRIKEFDDRATGTETQKSPVLTQEEYKNTVADLTYATKAIENARTNYQNQIEANNEKLTQSQSAIDALNAKAESIRLTDPDAADPKAVKELETLYRQIAAANRAHYKLQKDVNGANENARKEMESVIANNSRVRDIARRKLDDHNIAYDLSMQQHMARQDVEHSISELEEIEQHELRVYDRLQKTTDVSEIAALEDQLSAFSQRRGELNDQIDESLHTEDWSKMENSEFLKKWNDDTNWQDALTRYAQYNERTANKQTEAANATPITIAGSEVMQPAIEQPETEQTVPANNGPVEHFSNPTVQAIVDGARRMGRIFYRTTIGSGAMNRLTGVQTGIQNNRVTVNDQAQLVRSARETVRNIQETAMVDINGNTTAESWTKAISAIPEQMWSQFQEYLLHKHNISRMSLEDGGLGSNKPVIGHPDGAPFTAQESQAFVDAYEQAHPDHVNAANNIYNWWDTFARKWLVDGGLLSEDAYDNMRAMYPYYVPTYRKEAQQASSGKYGHSLGIANPVHAATGSVAEVEDIRGSVSALINKFVRSERKNELLLNMYTFTRNYPDAARGYAAIVDGPQLPTSNSVDELELENINQVEDGTYIVRLKEDGEWRFMNVSEEMGHGLSRLLETQTNDSAKSRDVAALENVLRKVSNGMKAGITTYNPLFAIVNIARDFQTSFVNTEASVGDYLKNVKDAVVEIGSNSENWQRFKALGGDQSGMVQTGRDFVDTLYGEKSFRNTIRKATRAVGDVLSAPGTYSESVFRFAEYLEGIRKYGDTAEGRRKAIQMAADVTVNFSRNGAATKFVDAFVPYLNAQVQGIDKMARQLKNHPVRTIGRSAPFVALAVGLLKGLGNDDNPHYQNLSNRVKDTNFLVPNVFGERDSAGFCTTFIKLPKSREYGTAIVALAERVARLIDGDKQAFDGWADTVVDGLAFSNPFTDSIYSPIESVKTNKNYYGGDIVPQYMTEDAVTEQYNAQTSLVARNLSQSLAGLGIELSPMHIDYMINQYGGFFGNVLTSSTAEDSTGVTKALGELIEDKFVADPLYASGVTERFYDAIDQAKSDASIAKGQRLALGSSNKTKEERKLKELQQYQSKISDLRKQERKLLEMDKDTPQRKDKIDEIRRKINELAAEALEKAG